MNNTIVFYDPFGLMRTSCPSCGDHNSDVHEGANIACANIGGNPTCRNTILQLLPGGITCMHNKCKEGLHIECGSCSGCGTINSDGDIVLCSGSLLPQPNLCGPIEGTVAHELSHLCGVGNDGTKDRASSENRRKAKTIELACRDKNFR